MKHCLLFFPPKNHDSNFALLQCNAHKPKYPMGKNLAASNTVRIWEMCVLRKKNDSLQCNPTESGAFSKWELFFQSFRRHFSSCRANSIKVVELENDISTQFKVMHVIIWNTQRSKYCHFYFFCQFWRLFLGIVNHAFFRIKYAVTNIQSCWLVNLGKANFNWNAVMLDMNLV